MLYTTTSLVNVNGLYKNSGQAYREALVYILVERDGWMCDICDEECHPEDASIDHILPISFGGQHRVSNFRLIHNKCQTWAYSRFCEANGVINLQQLRIARRKKQL